MTQYSRPVRIALAVLYGVGALIHLYFSLFAPELYEVFVEMALLEVYRELWLAYVVPNLHVLLPAVIMFEAGIAAALLWRGSVVTVANLAGGCFQLGLVLSGPWGLLNLGLAGVHFFLAQVDFQEPAVRRRNSDLAES